MRACNGKKSLAKPTTEEVIEITRLEPVVVEVERDESIHSHLILFEIICKVRITDQEMKVTGDIKETVFEVQERED